MSDAGLPGPDVQAEALVGLLAESARLRVVAALALGATAAEAIEEATGLDGRQVRSALDRLVRGGLVAAAPDGGLRLVEECFRAAARASSDAVRAAKVTVEELGASPTEAKVLRPFFDDGRLTGIPAPRPKRLALLNFLAGRFEPGKVYQERDVNNLLGEFFDDVATLRRYLVDEEFLERRGGFYWRAGGSFSMSIEGAEVHGAGGPAAGGPGAGGQASEGRVRQVRAEVEAFVAAGPEEAGWRQAFLGALDRLAAPFDRDADPTHVTASGIVVSERGVLLHRHRLLGLWLQPGGHLDPGELPAGAAIREVGEETGLAATHAGPGGAPVMIHLYVGPGGRGHTHLDLRYLLGAPPEEARPPESESQEVAWFDWDDALAIADPGLIGALRAARSSPRQPAR